MTDKLRYGDTVKLPNSYNGWNSGNLSTFQPNNGLKYDVCTRCGVRYSEDIWRIESGAGNNFGSEIKNGDIVLLRNLWQCDGGYLQCRGNASQNELYQVSTGVLAGPPFQPQQLWQINKEAATSGDIIINGDTVSFRNQYGALSFLETFNAYPKENVAHANTGTLYDVYTSDVSKSDTGLWKIDKTEDPCPQQYPDRRDHPNDDHRDDSNAGAGDTHPRSIPGLPADTRFTVILVNNENWVRTARLVVDGKDEQISVPAHQVSSGTFTTSTGNVTLAMVDSQSGPMKTPLAISAIPLGEHGQTIRFGAEKMLDEKMTGYMDIFVHIDWATDIRE
ncbi:hypothetical protein [Trabulsiella odontotermitis]|uniref:hypothetical protein n=1 Tax=Trabulsiella odontotermitis TaxID=379893 RepID=UPI000A93AC17|nr:hypothetical protein [Trabulsiella odontotermitis]